MYIKIAYNKVRKIEYIEKSFRLMNESYGVRSTHLTVGTHLYPVRPNPIPFSHSLFSLFPASRLSGSPAGMGWCSRSALSRSRPRGHPYRGLFSANWSSLFSSILPTTLRVSLPPQGQPFSRFSGSRSSSAPWSLQLSFPPTCSLSTPSPKWMLLLYCLIILLLLIVSRG